MNENSAAALTLHDVFLHNCGHFPQRNAMRIDGHSITYAQLQALVDQTRSILSPHVARGDRVVLWMHNSFSWVASFIALNALGAVSVPVNTRLTGSELLTIVGDAGAQVLITTNSYRGRAYIDEAMEALKGCQTTVFSASDDLPPASWPCISGSSRTQAPLVGPAGLFCIQYTSGTTSTPKGVMLTNEGYLRTAAYVARCQRLTPSTEFISAGPFFHCSGSMHAITTCLLAGSTLTSMSVWDPEHYLDLVETHQCDVSHMVYYRDVLSLNRSIARHKLRSMRVTHDLGTREYLLGLHDELGLAGISNIYGMTETAGQYTMWCPDDPLESRISANGRPQPGNLLRLGDPETGEALPRGKTGEIQMCGSTLSPGYFNRPEADAAARTADGWLRSGDLGQLTDSGELVYIARLKEIIRVGGENLAPAEVEQVMRDHCNLPQVCVLGVPNLRLDEVPAAVVVGAVNVEWSAVLQSMRSHLAGFKIPREIYLAESFPTTATNKVQRSVLKELIADSKLTRVV
ncbi:MAG: acyl--CoA ligase [Polaromonas sp.]|uniref:class I adenylate-forming enzyme family protein n=1 Tax=Polaromonas sp. TaxID=1869339 RepID=UPI0025DFA63F|nr:class I adenylate-forming enzyme family protein [Polaromonas sp.]MBI2727731.1 acyl--CoA ligase [Polaromonas sp.]